MPKACPYITDIAASCLAGFVFPAVVHDFFHIRLRPLGELAYEGEERFACLGEAVFDFRRNFGLDFAADETVGFEGAEGGREHA